MPLQVDRSHAEPLYRQLYSQIRRGILSGRLPPGTRLPSSRELANRLGVARLTVTDAYDRLSGEGYIESKPGAWTAVAASLPGDLVTRTDTDSGRVQKWEARLSELSMRMRAMATTADFPVSVRPPVTYDFRNAFRMPPMKEWHRILARHWSSFDAARAISQPSQGHAGLRSQIARHLGTTRGVDCGPDQVVVTNSDQQVLDLVAHVLLDPGDRVLIEDPGKLGARLLFGSPASAATSSPPNSSDWALRSILRISSEFGRWGSRSACVGRRSWPTGHDVRAGGGRWPLGGQGWSVRFVVSALRQVSARRRGRAGDRRAHCRGVAALLHTGDSRVERSPGGREHQGRGVAVHAAVRRVDRRASLVPLAKGVAVDVAIPRVALVIRNEMPMGVVVDLSDGIATSPARPTSWPVRGEAQDSVEALRDRALHNLFADHLVPAIARVHDSFHLARSLLWTTVAEQVGELYTSAITTAVAADDHARHRILTDDRAAILDAEHVPGTVGPSPLRNRFIEEPTSEPGLPPFLSVRRICCTCYVIPGRDTHCRSCPLLSPADRQRMLRSFLIRSESFGPSSAPVV